MKLIALPLLFSIGYVGFEHHDKIIDQYNAAYPSDPARSAALAKCATRDPGFIRLDADEREHCYRAVFGNDRTALELPARVSPSYLLNASSVSANDIRRQQTNENFRPPVRAAAPTTLTRIAPKAAPTHHWQKVHHAEVKRTGAS